MKMLRVAGRVVLVAVAAVAFAAGCDTATAPTTAPDASSSVLGLDPGDLFDNDHTVQVLERSRPLTADEVVARDVGSSGGVITLPEAGLILIIPPGAVPADTTITVVAPSGDLVGYHFFPEGLVFDRPVLAIQDMLVTEAALRGIVTNLFAAYFEGPLAPTVDALEIIPLSLPGRFGLFPIEHFSGYVIATN